MDASNCSDRVKHKDYSNFSLAEAVELSRKSSGHKDESCMKCEDVSDKIVLLRVSLRGFQTLSLVKNGQGRLTILHGSEPATEQSWEDGELDECLRTFLALAAVIEPAGIN